MIIAHRGYWDKYIPENSMTAFIRCVERNIPIELDVHLTKDNKVVVFHDYDLFRMTGVSKRIEETNYEELQKYNLKKSYEKIPLLEDVLKIVNNKILVLIELKNKKVGPLENKVLKITEKYFNCYFQSFNLKSVYYLKARTDKKVGLLVMNKISKKLSNSKKIDFIAQNLLTIEFSKTKKELFVFTIDNNRELDKALKYTNNVLANIYKLDLHNLNKL